jgi:hypothetical protein
MGMVFFPEGGQKKACGVSRRQNHLGLEKCLVNICPAPADDRGNYKCLRSPTRIYIALTGDTRKIHAQHGVTRFCADSLTPNTNPKHVQSHARDTVARTLPRQAGTRPAERGYTQ